MRGASLRALLLALAMVIQTIAGVSGVAHAGSSPGVKDGAGHCALAAVAQDLPSPAHDSPNGDCGHCVICLLDTGDAIATPFLPTFMPGVGVLSPVESRPESRPAGHALDAWRARGPPADRA